MDSAWKDARGPRLTRGLTPGTVGVVMGWVQGWGPGPGAPRPGFMGGPYPSISGLESVLAGYQGADPPGPGHPGTPRSPSLPGAGYSTARVFSTLQSLNPPAACSVLGPERPIFTGECPVFTTPGGVSVCTRPGVSPGTPPPNPLKPRRNPRIQAQNSRQNAIVKPDTASEPESLSARNVTLYKLVQAGTRGALPVCVATIGDGGPAHPGTFAGRGGVRRSIRGRRGRFAPISRREGTRRLETPHTACLRGAHVAVSNVVL